MPGDIEELAHLLHQVESEISAAALQLGRTIHRLRAGAKGDRTSGGAGVLAEVVARSSGDPRIKAALAAVVATTGCTAAEAFEMLLRATSRRGISVRDLAGELLRNRTFASALQRATDRAGQAPSTAA